MLAAARLRRRLNALKAARGRKIRPKRKPKARARQTETESDNEVNAAAACDEDVAMKTDEEEVGNVAFYEGLSDSDETEVGNVAFYEGLSDSDETEVGNVAFYQGLSDTDEDEGIEGNVAITPARWEPIFVSREMPN